MKSEGEKRRRREYQRRKRERKQYAQDLESNRQNCAKKRQFPNRTVALHAMATTIFASENAQALDTLDVYNCLNCGLWHIGHRWRKARQDNDRA